jgi:hypothetical protein
MQKWLLSAVLGVVFGSVAVLAQGQPPPDDRQPQLTQPPPQQLLHQQMLQHQLAMQQQQQMQVSQPRCPLGRHAWPVLGLLVLVTTVIHTLLAVWVYQDLRRRNTGSGLWIVITLLAGLCGAAVYALVRLGEKPA